MRTFFRMRDPLRSVDRVGPGARVTGAPIVRNGGRIEIGRDFRFSGTPARSHLVATRTGTIVIGDGVRIDHGAAIFSTLRVTIGDGARIGPHCFIMDSDFHRSGAFESASDVAPISVGRRAIVGANVVLLRGARIGDGATIAPSSVIGNEEVPAGGRVGGVPARPLDEGSSRSGTVPEIIAQVLGLGDPPSPADELQSLPGWESLAQLRILLALEDSFGAISSAGFMKARTVADIVGLTVSS
jgi:acetyltransferase-like isoleucine patch superfamily enzyme